MEERGGTQSLFVIRHGDRWDYANRDWSKTSSRPGDPPLSPLGLQQARETGLFLSSIFSAEGITADNISWMSSPFLRCVQTSNAAIDALNISGGNEINILPEYSIFEWDGYDGKLHESIPPLSERKHYFPRLDTDYQSVFVPTLPEPRSEFHDRCRRAVDSIGSHIGFTAGTAIIAVSHAAGCIGMTSAAANLTAADITPAAPCSIYRLTRTSDTSVWSLDNHAIENSMNGHTAHMSNLGSTTVPWNNFADKKHFRGYTGPPTSRFAPEGYHAESRDEL